MRRSWRWYRRRKGWWRWLVSVMTGDRCHRWKKMMGRGPEGGCGTDERPCRPIFRVSDNEPQITSAGTNKATSVEVDFFSQARKALCMRSPFDVPEDTASATVSTLPSGLASLLRQSEYKKKHKKSHSGADKKSSRASERSKGGKIWIETEDYFRDLALPDIDSLFEISFPLKSLAGSKLLFIPHVGNEKIGRVEFSVNTNNVVDDLDKNVNSGNGNENENGVVKKDEDQQEEQQFMEIDSVGTRADVAICSSQEEGNIVSVSGLPSSSEWLLTCKNRVLLTSVRPSKKRKLSGSDAGLDKVLIATPRDVNSSLCDFCCKGETSNDSNKLIVCYSCKVAVHRHCYGVQGDVDASWLCSWCKQKIDSNDLVKQPCALCSSQGGALKPVGLENGDSSEEFVHLFCSLWMPEVYIDDVVKMEPIMNVGGIKETRRKLVCNICKVKRGACVRCSNGTCRTAFHPLCARDASHRMEVWGKHESDSVELRAFCLKHSESSDGKNTCQLGDSFVAVSSDCLVVNPDKQHKLMIGQNGDKIASQLEIPVSNSDKVHETVVISDSRLKETSECGDMDQLLKVGVCERSNSEDSNTSESLNFVLIFKKLIDQGNVSVKDVATEMGVSPNILISALGEDGLISDLQCKIVKWLKNHAYMGTSENLKLKLKSTLLSKTQIGTIVHSDGVKVSESNNSRPVAAVKLLPQRRTKSNIRILKDGKVICTSDEFVNNNGVMLDEAKVEQSASENLENSSEVSMLDTAEKISKNSDGFEGSLPVDLPKSERSSNNPSDNNASEKNESIHAVMVDQSDSINTNDGNLVHSDGNTVFSDLRTETLSGFYVHSSIDKKLLQIQKGQLVKNQIYEYEVLEGRSSRLEASSSAGVCCNDQNEHKMCNSICKLNGLNSDLLVKAKKLGVFELSPEDEVEGEIIYFQDRLLDNAVARKRFTDNLICKVAGSLSREINAARAQKWDAVLVNQYHGELREAKKQGRKERKHKEAQAVLAATTAAAAASSRISSFRKDTFDEFSHNEKYNASNGRGLISSQLMPRPKETLSRVAAPRNLLEKQSDFVHSVSDFTKEHARSCDICRRSETILNSILVCSSCKVAVHLNCYLSVKESKGPWYCELCEELLLSKGSGAASVSFWEKPYFVAECSLCGGTTGAFRKTTGGQWVHAFCAEWAFELTFRRGQVNPVEGMDTVAKGIHICCICRRKNGVCIKCSYGHCQITFHPACARSTGFYMNVKTVNGKLQHKAYCEKHSLEQRAKAETQKHGVEEIKSIKQVRVELERLRLLCERIIRREKIKRELVLCSHSILACKKDQVVCSVRVRSPFSHLDASSESATTSLKCNTDGYKSYSDAIQRSDDVTVDSTLSVKPQIRFTMSMENDQKTEDSSTSHKSFNRKPSDRVPFAGKQIPRRSLASQNLLDEGEWSSKSRKRFETFEKELVMTSDQATMKNQRLPKGYFYVPVDSLPKEKQINEDAHSADPMEHDG